MDHSVFLYNIMVSSHQFHTWDHGPLYLSIQHHDDHGLFTNSIHETRDHSICLYNTMVSSYQFHTWDQGSLSVYTTPWSLFHQVHTWDHRPLCLYNTMVFSHQFQTCWPWTTIYVYTASWSLLTNSIHETRDHSICLYESTFSSHQFLTWEKGPLYLYIQHHGLFSPSPYLRPGTTRSVLYNSMVFSSIPYTRPGTTLFVYALPWSLLTNSMHENMDYIFIHNTMVSSHQFHTWDHGPLYLSIQHHCLFSPIIYMRPGTTLSIQHHGLFSPIPYIDQGSLYLSLQHHGLFTQIPYMRPGTTLYNTMVSSHQYHTWDHGPLCLYNTIVSSHQFHTWDQGPLYLSIQHHGLFTPIPYMRQ